MFHILKNSENHSTQTSSGQSSGAINSDNNTSNGGPATQKIGKIEVKRDLCIGAQTCVAVAGDVFEMDAENKAIIKNPKGADDETILMAARSCPTLAIYIYDEKGGQIFP